MVNNISLQSRGNGDKWVAVPFDVTLFFQRTAHTILERCSGTVRVSSLWEHRYKNDADLWSKEKNGMFFLAKSPPLGLRSPRGIYSSLPASFSFLRALPRFVDVFGVNDIPKCMEIPGRRLRYPYPRQQTRRVSRW